MGLRTLRITSELLRDFLMNAHFHGAYFVKNGVPDDVVIMDAKKVGLGVIELTLASSLWDADTSYCPPELVPVLAKVEEA